MQELLSEIRRLAAKVEQLERKIDSHFSPTGPMTVQDKAREMAAALASGDPMRIKAAKRLAAGG